MRSARSWLAGLRRVARRARGPALLARATVHAITAARPPKPDLDDPFAPLCADAFEPDPARWRHVDLTVEPEGARADVTPYAPTELGLLGPDDPPSAARSLAEAFGPVHGVDVMQGGDWVALGGDRLVGAQRLRVLLESRDTAKRGPDGPSSRPRARRGRARVSH